MIINLKGDILSKFKDNEILINENKIGIFLFLNGKNYILGKFSKNYNLSSILDELIDFYSKVEIFDSYEINKSELEFVKNSEEGTYIKNGEIYKMKISEKQINVNFNYRIQVLCGNDSAHIYIENPFEVNFKEIIDRFQNCELSINPLILNIKCNQTSILLFKDGKALIKERDINEDRARIIYERIIFYSILKSSSILFSR